jgi:hypothetical protein
MNTEPVAEATVEYLNMIADVWCDMYTYWL